MGRAWKRRPDTRTEKVARSMPRSSAYFRYSLTWAISGSV